MKKKDYYRTLGLAPTADAAAIKKAYRRLALQHHPDVKPKDPKAAERFKEIAEAYAVLSNPAKRARYDEDYEPPLSASRPAGRASYSSTSSAGGASRQTFDASEWERPRPPRTPHYREENKQVFQTMNTLSYLGMGVFSFALLCCLFSFIITQFRQHEEQRPNGNQANLHIARTVTARVQTRQANLTATTPLPPEALAATQTANPHLTTTRLSDLPFGWRADDHAGPACFVDLATGEHTCAPIQQISVLYGPRNGEVLLRINLDPLATPYTRVLFVVQYGRAPDGWTVNIGDSRSNDGSGGDGGHQSNNAELHIHERQLTVFGREGTPPEVTPLLEVDDLFTVNTQTVALEVSNERLRWWRDSDGVTVHEIHSPYLFALNGQPDSRGGVNYDLYAAFGRVISSTANRPGRGVARVDIRLMRPEQAGAAPDAAASTPTPSPAPPASATPSLTPTRPPIPFLRH